ncbi:MAG: class I adenylate-forming enzyme family protein [Bacilli bacterium]
MIKSNLKPSEEMIWQKYQSEDAKNINFPKMSVLDLIKEENQGSRLDNTALNYYDNKVSYGQLFDNIDKTIESLKLKIKCREIVTIASLTTLELVYLFYALSELRAISNMIDPRTHIKGIINYTNEAKSDKFVTLNLFNNKFASIFDQTTVNQVINYSLRDSAIKGLPTSLNIASILCSILSMIKYNDGMHINYEDFVNSNYKGAHPTVNIPEYEENMPLTIVHTGGTTGHPKGAVLSHDGFNAMAWQYKYSGLDLKPKDILLNIMPPWLAYGFNMIHMSLVMGMEVVMIPKFDSKTFDKNILKYKPNHFAGVPSSVGGLKNSKILQKQKDLSFIKTPACGGAGIEPQLHKEGSDFLKERNAAEIASGYALTESNSVFSVCIGNNIKYGSAGFPLPGGTMGIFDSQNNELNYNEKGELCICTPTRMLRYFENEAETNKSLQIHADGKVWIHTGDIACIDNDGFLWIEDRIKNVIIRSDGFKIYPNIIAKVIETHKYVKQCKVVGITDHNAPQGQLPKAYIILENENKIGYKQLIDEINTICQTMLPEYYIPNKFETLKTFPLTPNGKIDEIFLRKMEEDKNIKGFYKILARK